MNTRIEATFEIAGWDETPFEDSGDEDAKLTEALVKKRYSGEIDGESTTKWLMSYAPDKSATYVGIEHITGTVGGRRGGLVLMHDGEFARRRRDGGDAHRVGHRRPGRRDRRRKVPRRPGRLGGSRPRQRLSRYCSLCSGGKPPVATGPHRVGVTRIRHLP